MENKLFLSLSYDLDFVFCLDMTCANQGIEYVREGLRDFYGQICESYEAGEKSIGTFRVRFVLFKDYKYDQNAMIESQFFTLPDDMDEALAFVNSYTTGGGGDLPENALEALSIAMDSDWNTKNDRRRQIIVLATDSIPHPLGKYNSDYCLNYPENMPKSLEELHEKWDSLGRWRRMFIFAPLRDAWRDICEWYGVFCCNVRDALNCTDVNILEELSLLHRCIES